MLRLSRYLALFAGVIFLAGCAGTPAIPYDRSTAAEIKTIGVLTPRFPDGPRVVLASTVGQSFGLIGALVDAGMQANRQSSFSSLLAGQRFSVADSFQPNLVSALQAHGYAVELIPVTRDKPGFLPDYHVATNVKVDAYLDINPVAYGYLAAGVTATAPYRPFFVINCQLVRAADGAVLMRDAIVYNPINPRGGVITIAPDPAYQFVDFDTLMADPPRSVAGLNEALTQTAQSVGNLLR
jgi:hypothetical protein